MSNESCCSLGYRGKVKDVMEGGLRASWVAPRYHLPSIRGALLALGRGQILKLQNVLFVRFSGVWRSSKARRSALSARDPPWTLMSVITRSKLRLGLGGVGEAGSRSLLGQGSGRLCTCFVHATGCSVTRGQATSYNSY